MNKFRWIQLDRIKGNPVRASEYPPAEYELYLDMKKRGLVNPITVRAIPRKGWFWFLKPQYYELIDGYLRTKVAVRLGWKSIQANVMTLTDLQVIEASIIASRPYVPTSPKQYQAALRKILEMHPDMTHQQLADRIGWTLERLERVLNDNDLRDLQ